MIKNQSIKIIFFAHTIQKSTKHVVGGAVHLQENSNLGNKKEKRTFFPAKTTLEPNPSYFVGLIRHCVQKISLNILLHVAMALLA